MKFDRAFNVLCRNRENLMEYEPGVVTDKSKAFFGILAYISKKIPWVAPNLLDVPKEEWTLKRYDQVLLRLCEYDYDFLSNYGMNDPAALPYLAKVKRKRSLKKILKISYVAAGWFLLIVAVYCTCFFIGGHNCEQHLGHHYYSYNQSENVVIYTGQFYRATVDSCYKVEISEICKERYLECNTFMRLVMSVPKISLDPYFKNIKATKNTLNNAATILNEAQKFKGKSKYLFPVILVAGCFGWNQGEVYATLKLQKDEELERLEMLNNPAYIDSIKINLHPTPRYPLFHQKSF